MVVASRLYSPVISFPEPVSDDVRYMIPMSAQFGFAYHPRLGALSKIVDPIVHVNLERPLTHDLLKNICSLLEAKLSMVLISDVRDGTYFAELHLWHQDKELVVDSRPSDAIALALRTAAPIYISEKVAEGSLAIKDLLNEEQHQELKELLESSRPSDVKKSLH